MIFRFSFRFRLVRNSTSRPTPLLTSSPAIIWPAPRIPARYSWVTTTEEAQLGISPTRAARKTPSTGLPVRKPERASSPSRWMASSMAREITSRKRAICRVCRRADLTMLPSSQWQ